MAEVPLTFVDECPEESMLRRAVQGELGPIDEAEVASHVEFCARCRQWLDGQCESLPVRVGLLLASCLDGPPQPAMRGAFAGIASPLPTGPYALGEAWSDTPAETAPAPARIGEYRVVGELGHGSFGVVYLAHDDALDRRVAIKVPHPDVVRKAGGIELYRKESQALAKLDHPHVVRVYHAEMTADGSCFVVSQYVEGRPLSDRLAERRMSPAEAARLAAPLADALQHAHEKGIVHRDVKPGNILLDTSGKPYLVDFGLALKEEEVGQGPHELGTPAYMSPEQARGEGHQVDGRADVFSLGVVFFEALTGKRPFAAESCKLLRELIASADAPRPRQKDRAIPAALDAICARALARRVQDRYGSAGELAADLNAWLESEGHVTTYQVGPTVGGFELRGCIGSGGMGDVFRAWQPNEQREVALKCLRKGDATARARFLAEIRALGNVVHPNLVRIYTSGSGEQQLYYAMELIDGANFKTIYRLLRQAGTHDLDVDTWRDVLSKASDETRSHEQPLDHDPFEAPDEEPGEAEPLDYLDYAPMEVFQSQEYVRQIATVIVQVAGAVQALHDKGIVHRDVKPENIMLTRAGDRAVLMDLGIAKLTQVANGRFTRTREFVGSLRYASPEQVLDAGRIDHRSDVYSLGVTLWELLTLRPIYGIGKSVSDHSAMVKIGTEEPEPARKYNRAVPMDLQAIVQRCLEKSPGRRYQSAAELTSDLEAFLRGQPVKARPVGPAARLWRRWRRRPLVSSLSAGIVLLAWGLVAVLIASGRKPVVRDWMTLRVGVKPWVGYSPIAVARDANLCNPYSLEFVLVKDLDDALSKIANREIDVMMCPVETVVYARGKDYRVKAILKADESYGADAIVARPWIKDFGGLRGKRVAFMSLDAPHYLLLALCERHGINMSDLQLEPCKTVQEALRQFEDGAVDAAVIYEPFIEKAKEAGGHLLACSGKWEAKERPIIVDVWVFHEDWLSPERSRGVEAFIRGWCEGAHRLDKKAPLAAGSARKFLGRLLGEVSESGISEIAYHKAAAEMKYSGKDDNLAFFNSSKDGSEFHKRVAEAFGRLNRERLMNGRVTPAECDASWMVRGAAPP